jgi:uncharacterized membrane protein
VYCCRICCSMCVLLSYLLFCVCIVVVLVVLCVYCFRSCCTIRELLYVCVVGFTVDAELLARSQYSEGPATGHLLVSLCL